jgi:hypothetical protein
MYQAWRKRRANCISVTTPSAKIAAGTGASITLNLNLNSNVYVPVPSNTTASITSQVIQLAARTTHSWGYACTQ